MLEDAHGAVLVAGVVHLGKGQGGRDPSPLDGVGIGPEFAQIEDRRTAVFAQLVDRGRVGQLPGVVIEGKRRQKENEAEELDEYEGGLSQARPKIR